MAWIELHQALPTHRKTLALADALDVEPVQVVGHLICLWLWAIDNAPSGEIDMSHRTIARAAQWTSDPDRFFDGLVSSGFLDVPPDGAPQIHDWQEYVGKLMEQRAHHAQRTMRNRTLYADMDVVYEVRSRDGDLCRFCARAVDWKDRRGVAGGTYDHLDPEGPNTADNVVVCCRSCNSKKGRRTPDESGMRVLPPPSHPDPDGTPSERQVNGKKPAADLLTVPDLTGPNRTVNPPSATQPAPAPETSEPLPGPTAAAVLDTTTFSIAEQTRIDAVGHVLAPIGLKCEPRFWRKVLDTYGEVDLEAEALKMADWQRQHQQRQCSQRFVLNWLDNMRQPPRERPSSAITRNDQRAPSGQFAVFRKYA